MKKFIYAITMCILCTCVKSQTLTAAVHLPTLSVQDITKVDSTGTIPSGTGEDQVWDFSAFTNSMGVLSNSYVPYSLAYPYANQYSGCNIYLMSGSSSSAGTFLNGSADSLTYFGSGNTAVFNPMIRMQYPFSYGSTFTDRYLNQDNGNQAYPITDGTVVISATGTGTLVLPGNYSIGNILQVTEQNTYKVVSPLFPTMVSTFKSRIVTYYHGSTKFPLLLIEYSWDSNNVLTAVFIWKQVNINVGVQEFSKSAERTLHPVPATDYFSIMNLEPGSFLRIMDISGKIVKEITQTPGEKVDVSNLKAGVYIVSTSHGTETLYYKLVKE